MKRDDILGYSREQLLEIGFEEPYTAEYWEGLINSFQDCAPEFMAKELEKARSRETAWTVCRMVFWETTEDYELERVMGTFPDKTEAERYAAELNAGYRTTDVYIVTDLIG